MNARLITCAALLALASGCSQMRPEAPPTETGHLNEASTSEAPAIPEVVQQAPYVPPPEPVPEGERYTVVVNDVPVRELLFALARDADMNIDIGGNVEGKVTINAIDQTLPQILDRISRQVDMRYEFAGGTVVITPDEPYFRTYEVDYVNLSRDADTTVNVATEVATTGQSNVQQQGGGGGGGGGGRGGNTSGTRLQSKSYHRFWETLNNNILAMLGETEADQSGLSDKVVMNAESGMISVKATRAQHELIEQFIDRVIVSARRQVMVEATIVEVTLNDQYQAGVDWDLFLNINEPGFDVNQSLLGAVTDGVVDNAISSFRLSYFDPELGNNAVSASVRLLREFGDAKVLSSPRLMVLNNQTAILKVVEELVYFSIEVTDQDSTATQQGSLVVESEVHSVPVGLVMTVTPQISPSNEITLTVRPTISERIGDAIDPGPQIAAQLNQNQTDASITNLVPIIRVRELESVLKLIDGQIGVLGGLMQDSVQTGNREVPGLASLPFIGDIFFDADEIATRKTELVVFLRPVVVGDPNIETDLNEYKQYLGGQSFPSPTTAAARARP